MEKKEQKRSVTLCRHGRLAFLNLAIEDYYCCEFCAYDHRHKPNIQLLVNPALLRDGETAEEFLWRKIFASDDETLYFFNESNWKVFLAPRWVTTTITFDPPLEIK